MMAQARMLNRSVAIDERLNGMSQAAMLFYLMSVPHLDRDGLIDGRPRVLLAQGAPLQDAWLTTGGALGEPVVARDPTRGGGAPRRGARADADDGSRATGHPGCVLPHRWQANLDVHDISGLRHWRRVRLDIGRACNGLRYEQAPVRRPEHQRRSRSVVGADRHRRTADSGR